MKCANNALNLTKPVKYNNIMDAKRIDMNDWDEFGGGAAGSSFYHKTDDGLVLKLYGERWPQKRSLDEYVRSRHVFEMGVPCPETYEYVTDGRRYGMISQRIRDKKSFYKILSEEHERVDEMARRFASAARKLHSIECDTSVFRPLKERYETAFANMVAPQDVKDDLLKILHGFQDGTRCIHGDMQGGNIITDGEKDYWIDLGDFSFGNPEMEFSTLWHNAINLGDAKILDMFHIHEDLNMEFTQLVFKYYHGADWLDEQKRSDIMLKIRLSAVIEFARWINIVPEETDEILPVVRRQLAELRNYY